MSIDPLLVQLIDGVDSSQESTPLKIIVNGCVLVGSLTPSEQWLRSLAGHYVDAAEDEAMESRLLQSANAPLTDDPTPPSQRPGELYLHLTVGAEAGAAAGSWRIRAADISGWAAGDLPARS